jgi:P4 family phage/plasmid primase-like protien
MSLQEFLYSRSTKEKDNCTHTRIGERELGIYGGSYCIPETDKEAFYRIYYDHVFVSGQLEYLTEKQLEVGPLAIDIDFRYHAEERLYNQDNIIDFVDILVTELQKLFLIERTFPVYVFEKPKINVQPSEIKDGIHFIVGISMDRTMREMIRNSLMKQISSIWEPLADGLANDWNSIVDERVMLGKTVWQLYGSRKPGNMAYKLTHIYDCRKDQDGDYELVHQKGDTFNTKLHLCKLSVQYTGYEAPMLQQNRITEYEDMRQVKKPKIKIVPHEEPIVHYTDIRSMSMLDKMLAKLIGNTNSDIHSSDYKLREIHHYTMILPESYYGKGSFDKWIRVGWALRNTDFRMFISWVKFSSQATDFSFDQVPSLFAQWCSWNKPGDTLSSRSIMYWARKEVYEKYKKVKEESIDFYLEEIIHVSKNKDVRQQPPAEFDIANLLYQKYKDIFVCVSIKNKIWYEYSEQRWIETDSGTNIRNKLSAINGIYGLFSKKLDLLQQEHASVDQTVDPDRHAYISRKMARICEISVQLKKTMVKNNVMREACDLFYIKDFMSLLDSKNNILCFSNGVIDFHTQEFRQGLPEDYTSKSTNIPYVTLSTQSKQVIREIEEFMEQLFPVEELRNYMWDHAASVLLGKNNNQTFNIYTGGGRNGKSKFVELMSKCLGEYKGTVPVTLITQKRTSIGGTSSEIVQLMGTRYAVMQEPSVGDQINEGIMKEITGGDPIQGRALFKDTVTFIPQFKLVVCTNNLFDIKSNDDGTWRRIRVCDFQSVFTENPVKGDRIKPYQFKVDKNIDTKFEVWKTVFMSMLVERAYKTGGDVVDCKMVLAKSEHYRQDQDHFSEFVTQNIIEDPEGSIKEQDVYEEFKKWWNIQYGRAVPKGKELFDYINKQFGAKVPRKRGPAVWKGIALTQPEEAEE